MNNTNCWFILIYFILFPYMVNAQDVSYEALKDISLKKGITVNGSFNLNSVAYQSNSHVARRDPFNWFANASLSINFFGIPTPLTFSYTNAKANYTQPFNRLRFVPQYKWIKLHLGTGSMNFNEYTLAGHVFKGYGFELTPKKYRFMFMKGSLRDALPYNILYPKNISFQSNAIGVLLGYIGKSWLTEWNMLSVKDDATSIPFIPLQTTTTPQSNFSSSVKTNFKPAKWLQLELMYAFSALLNDNRFNSLTKNNIDTNNVAGNYSFGFFSKIFPSKPGLSFYDAINVSAGFLIKKTNFQIKYQRVSPGYTSLGAYYVNNDFENITVAPSFNLWNGKVNITANTGLQWNNLDRTKLSSNSRWISLLNIGVTPHNRLVLNTALSNFTSYTRVRPPTDPFYLNGIDSLNFYQINNSFSQSAIYQFPEKSNKQSISLNISLQQMQDALGKSAEKKNNNLFIAANLVYAYAFSPTDLTGNLALNYYANQIQGERTIYIGPTLAFTKVLMNKQIPVNVSLSYNTSKTSGGLKDDIINAKLVANYTPPIKEKTTGHKQKESHHLKQNVNCSLQYILGNKLSEFVFNTGYSLNF